MRLFFQKIEKRGGGLTATPLKLSLGKKAQGKANINIFFNKIKIDRDFLKSLSLLQFRFVLFHEIGHFYYKSEFKADIYSINILAIIYNGKMGNVFNEISQILKNEKRLENIKKYLIWTKTEY